MLSVKRKTELDELFYDLEQQDYQGLSIEEQEYVELLTENYYNATAKILGKIADADKGRKGCQEN